MTTKIEISPHWDPEELETVFALAELEGRLVVSEEAE